MVTAAIVEEDILVRTDSILEDGPGFEWGAVVAGAVVAAAATFLLVLVGAAVGLSLAGTRNLSGGHSFLTIGAIYFLAAEGFGFALGGYITGRLMVPAVESDEEHFRADAHGLGMWSIAVVLGLGLVALMAAAGLGQTVKSQSQPMAYWADKLLTGAPMTDYAVRNDEVSRLLTADMVHPDPGDDRNQLISLVSVENGMPAPVAEQRIASVENSIRAEADAARRAALYLAMWSAFALLFGGFAAIASTVMARWHTGEVPVWKR